MHFTAIIQLFTKLTDSVVMTVELLDTVLKK